MNRLFQLKNNPLPSSGRLIGVVEQSSYAVGVQRSSGMLTTVS